MNREERMTEFKKVIVKNGLTQREVAEMLGLTRVGLINKMTGSSDFFAHEIATLKVVLNLTNEDVNRILLGI